MERSLPSLATEESSVKTHTLVEELRGIVLRLRGSDCPVVDNSDHLTPLCETLEAILRHGLKKPNTWFGFNKQDYWSWIEPLQDYYFNQKENPLLREVVLTVAKSRKCRSVVGSGRCFIRVALNQKLISVPIEHLAANKRLTQYWYSNDSIIGDPALRDRLMAVLFEVTNVDFQLTLSNSSFLDETWVLPVVQSISIAPVKTLNTLLSYVDNRALVVELEKDCLAEQAGVEVGDVLDEVCGTPVHGNSRGKLKPLLAAHSIDSTDFVIVKKHLPDGCLFLPILQRQLENDELAGVSGRKHKRRPSDKIQTVGTSTEYCVAYLGKEDVCETSQEVIDRSISRVLTSDTPTQSAIVSVAASELLLLAAGSREELGRWGLSAVASCGRGEVHGSCIALLVTAHTHSLCAHVLETPSIELAQAVSAQIVAAHFASKGGYYLSAAFIQERPLIEHIRYIYGHHTKMSSRVLLHQYTKLQPVSFRVTLLRCVCSESDPPLEVFTGPVPRDKLKVSYSRSGGPGGQNVNKLNTKAEVRFHVPSADWLPERVKERVQLMFKPRLTKDGELIIISQKHRSQHMNLSDAISRLEALLEEASEVPKGPSQQVAARVRALKRIASRKRLTDKKYHSNKKKDRS
ncbi:uncharacterized protein LOC135351436 [Halichondria panicea]|uniref:uncharacterized protein LOC135351436 n=1 Tax=Halichondria panicea TaxID=6063 RepID=UPI00312B4907